MSNARSRLRALGHTAEQLEFMTSRADGPKETDLEQLADKLDQLFPPEPAATSPGYEVRPEGVELGRNGTPPRMGTYTPPAPYAAGNEGAEGDPPIK